MKLKHVLCAAILYVFIASAVYRYRHPKMTETELFLKLPRALMWQSE